MTIPAALLDRERDFARAFRPAALYGVRLDAGQVERLTDEHTAARAAARERAESLSDGQILNPKSNTQVAPYLVSTGRYELPVSKNTGKPGAGKAALEPYVEMGDPLAKAVVDYRHEDTALTLLLAPRTELLVHGDGRVRTSILTLAADTGRTSSRNENLQQVSRQGGMRACHLAEPGCLICSADFASVEVRVGAALSGDDGLKQMIRYGDAYPDRKKEFDLHWIAAQTVFGKDASKEDRYNSKRYIFRRMYGGEPITPVMESVFAAFNRIAPGYAAWDAAQRRYARSPGAVFETYSGRLIKLPRNAEHAAGNYMIQGSAREFLVDAVAKWERGRWGRHTLIPVHDEVIVFNIPEDEADAATAFLVECMTTSLNGVNIIAEANPPSPFWMDASLCGTCRGMTSPEDDEFAPDEIEKYQQRLEQQRKAAREKEVQNRRDIMLHVFDKVLQGSRYISGPSEPDSTRWGLSPKQLDEAVSALVDAGVIRVERHPDQAYAVMVLVTE